jgi:hypothetical protein
MLTYRLLLLCKFLGVVAYAGGLAGSFLSSAPAERKRAAHLVASPALIVTWAAGAALAGKLGVRLIELWVIGGFALSLVSQLALITSVSRGSRSPAALACSAAPLALVLALMVFRPTWAQLAQELP